MPVDWTVQTFSSGGVDLELCNMFVRHRSWFIQVRYSCYFGSLARAVPDVKPKIRIRQETMWSVRSVVAFLSTPH